MNRIQKFYSTPRNEFQLSNLNEINFGKRIRLQLYRTPKQGRLLRETEQTVEVLSIRQTR